MDSHSQPARQSASVADAVQPPPVMAAARAAPLPLLSTGSLFHLPLPHIARIARAAGFQGLDLVMGSPKICPGPELDAAHALCPVHVIHAPFRNWSAWGGHMDAWRAAVALAGRLRCQANGRAVHVTLHPPAGTLRDAIQTRWFARAVGLPRLLGAEPGVELSLENLPWAVGALFGRDNLAALVDQCREKELGLTLDCCHLGVSGRDILADLERIPAGLVRHVHCSDASGYVEHLPPGAGELPVGPFLARLGSLCAGHAPTVSLELDPAHLPEDEAGQARRLEGLRLGMEAALAGRPPEAWAGRAGRREAGATLAALG